MCNRLIQDNREIRPGQRARVLLKDPAGTRLEGLLLAPPAGKDYRLLKIVTRAATPDEYTRLGNSRIPVTAGGR